MVALNFIFAIKYAHVHAGVFKAFLPPLIAMVCCVPMTVGSFLFFKQIMPREVLATLLAVFITAILYAVALFVTRTFSKEDILMLPKGQKIYNFLVRKKIMK
jgi:hypothetical protein